MKTAFTLLLVLVIKFASAQTDSIQLVETLDKVYIWVEEQPYPHFPGCDTTLEQAGFVKCQQEKMKRFISANLKSPHPAVEALVNISFIIEEDGNVSNINVEQTPTPAFGEEAMRILKLLPKWKPGKQDGRLVRVKFKLPIRFKIS